MVHVKEQELDRHVMLHAYCVSALLHSFHIFLYHSKNHLYDSSCFMQKAGFVDASERSPWQVKLRGPEQTLEAIQAGIGAAFRQLLKGAIEEAPCGCGKGSQKGSQSL